MRIIRIEERNPVIANNTIFNKMCITSSFCKLQICYFKIMRNSYSENALIENTNPEKMHCIFVSKWPKFYSYLNKTYDRLWIQINIQVYTFTYAYTICFVYLMKILHKSRLNFRYLIWVSVETKMLIINIYLNTYIIIK